MNAIKIRQNILFHFIKFHDEQIPELRIWQTARYIDEFGKGWVDFIQLSKAARLTIKYCRRLCLNSELFRGLNDNKLYYQSEYHVMKLHRLNICGGKYRLESKEIFSGEGEKSFPWLRNTLGGVKYKHKPCSQFRAYIVKCWAERDLEKKLNYEMTKGMIGYNTIERELEIARDTAIRYMKISEARWENEIIPHPKYTFTSMREYGVWLNHNFEIIINGVRISSQPKSFWAVKVGYRKYVLNQTLPNRYYFTGVCLLNARPYRGKGVKTSIN
ncbi:hypothetical protein KAJ89_02410 [Candidatus Parcubacteria bacterium]|nr:hypothetical protein [Candidatus Parcubacteria bacterium]